MFQILPSKLFLKVYRCYNRTVLCEDQLADISGKKTSVEPLKFFIVQRVQAAKSCLEPRSRRRRGTCSSWEQNGMTHSMRDIDKEVIGNAAYFQHQEYYHRFH